MARILTVLLSGLLAAGLFAGDETVKPLKVLLVCGGCCHDYAKQKDILQKGLQARAHVEVTTVLQGGTATNSKIELYKNPDWAKGYDAVIHDECFAEVKELDWINGILKPHADGIPAVNLHCAMHCYRSGTDLWFKFLGLQSSGHGPQLPIKIAFVEKDHAAVKGLADWTTVNEELYNNLKVFDTAKPLAMGKQGDGPEVVVAWTNQWDKTRVFCTTIGHNNATVEDPRYLDMVTRGLLWSCDKLNDKYLKPAPKEEEKK